MDQKIDKILTDYQNSIVMAIKEYKDMDLLSILDANRAVYVQKIKGVCIENTIDKIKEALYD